MSNFYGHVMLGIMIHFLYLSQPNASKRCSFINSCIHLSRFWAFRKIFTAFTLQVYTHFFQKLVMIIEYLQRKAGSYNFSKACWLFKLDNLLLLFFSFFSNFLFHLFFSYYHLFIFSLSFFLFLSEKVVRTRAHTTYLRLTTR